MQKESERKSGEKERGEETFLSEGERERKKVKEGEEK